MTTKLVVTAFAAMALLQAALDIFSDDSARHESLILIEGPQ